MPFLHYNVSRKVGRGVYTDSRAGDANLVMKRVGIRCRVKLVREYGGVCSKPHPTNDCSECVTELHHLIVVSGCAPHSSHQCNMCSLKASDNVALP